MSILSMGLFTVIVFGAVPQVVRAEGPAGASSATITLGQALDEAERQNPEIRWAKKRWEGLKKRVVGAAALSNPRLDIERMYAPSGADVIGGADEKSFFISQEFPFPSTLFLRRGVAAKEAAMSWESYQAKVRDVLARVRSTYAVLYLSHKSFTISLENIEIMRRFTKVAESKYTAGHASQSDTLKSQVELTKLLNMHVLFAQEKESAEAMLEALLNRKTKEPIGIPADPEFKKFDTTLESLEASALEGRPELKEARIALKRSRQSLALARSEYLPGFTLGFRQRKDLMRGLTRDAILGLSLPLWFWKPAAMAGEAGAQKEMVEAELEAMEVMTLAELKSAWGRAQASHRLVEIYETSVFPQAETSLRVSEAGYQADKINFLELLDAQRTLLNFRLEYYQYIADYQDRIAQLERILGRGL